MNRLLRRAPRRRLGERGETQDLRGRLPRHGNVTHGDGLVRAGTTSRPTAPPRSDNPSGDARPSSGPAHDGGPTLRARPPFDLALTALVLERHPSNRMDRWDGRTYRRLFSDGEVIVQALPGNSGLAVRGPDRPAALRALLGLDVDLWPFYQMAAADPDLSPLVRRLRGLKPQRFPTVWEAVCNAVACQQVSLASGLAALGRLADRHGAAERDLARVPCAETVVEADLRGLGFSRQKEGFLRGLAAACAGGALGGIEDASTPEAYERLLSLRGLGRWSAEYILLRGLGRYEVFPADDVGAARILSAVLCRPRLPPAEVRRTVERWGAWKGLVYFYLLGWKRTGGAGPGGAR